MESTLRDLTATRLKETGRNAAEAARIGDLERNFIHDILSGKKLAINARNVLKLAVALDTTPEAITAAIGGAKTPAVALPAESRREIVPAAITIPDPMPLDLPVYASGAIVAGKGGRQVEGFLLDRTKVVDHVRRPPSLAGARDAYAFYVVGDSMKPQHKAGSLIFVHPHRPVQPGDTALILVKLGSDRPIDVYIRNFAGRAKTAVIAEQLNPPSVVKFKTDTVVAVHKVLTMNEIFAA